MGTTVDKLQKLMQTKDDIKTAINDPELGDRFADYPTAITDGKAYIAQKITEKGVAASRNDTFQQLGDKVGEIQSGETSQWKSLLLSGTRSGKLTIFEHTFENNGKNFLFYVLDTVAGDQKHIASIISKVDDPELIICNGSINFDFTSTHKEDNGNISLYFKDAFSRYKFDVNYIYF